MDDLGRGLDIRPECCQEANHGRGYGCIQAFENGWGFMSEEGYSDTVKIVYCPFCGSKLPGIETIQKDHS